MIFEYMYFYFVSYKWVFYFVVFVLQKLEVIMMFFFYQKGVEYLLDISDDGYCVFFEVNKDFQQIINEIGFLQKLVV